ncbi:MAG: adenylosuccinate synthase [Bacteroidales bacterium]|nr:adenylosuccinate synthase [Bacteroidales bacterium]
MKKVDVILGLQWGDEGKGKIVDSISPKYDVVARFQGGPNAGHSLKFDGDSFVMHTVPSGIFREGTLNIIGNGVVVDPAILMDEVRQIEAKGVDVKSKLLISKRANLILPTHRILDGASESAMGKGKIGSTLKGIGPAYMDKTGRYGLRIGDILLPDFKDRYEALKQRHLRMLSMYPDYSYDLAKFEGPWLAAIEELKQFRFIESERYVNDAMNNDVAILAEGAQGSLLDIDFGTYPFVTSSNTMASGVCTGLGIAPSRVGNVYGIFKAYCTRVGNGPFPTELFDETGDRLRKIGCEFGATTGRARRCGWLDMVALKQTVTMNGVTELIMMKPDVMDDFETIKVAVSYKRHGEDLDYFPYDADDSIQPVYKEFRGWKTALGGIRAWEDFPQAFKDYVAFIEAETGCPVKTISVGPDRSEIVFRD